MVSFDTFVSQTNGNQSDYSNLRQYSFKSCADSFRARTAAQLHQDNTAISPGSTSHRHIRNGDNTGQGGDNRHNGSRREYDENTGSSGGHPDDGATDLDGCGGNVELNMPVCPYSAAQ
jgi:hypothetical protein